MTACTPASVPAMSRPMVSSKANWSPSGLVGEGSPAIAAQKARRRRTAVEAAARRSTRTDMMRTSLEWCRRCPSRRSPPGALTVATMFASVVVARSEPTIAATTASGRTDTPECRPPPGRESNFGLFMLTNDDRMMHGSAFSYSDGAARQNDLTADDLTATWSISSLIVFRFDMIRRRA